MSGSLEQEIQVFVSSLMWVFGVNLVLRQSSTLTAEPFLQPRMTTDNYPQFLLSTLLPKIICLVFKIKFISLGAIVMAHQVKSGKDAGYQADNLRSFLDPTRSRAESDLLQVVI